MKGKNYANRKPIDQRPESDFYPTPYSLTRELMKLNPFPKATTLLEPACGEGAISYILKESGFHVIEKDLKTGQDFMEETDRYDAIITNPPFSQFDSFVMKAKEVTDQFAFIAKTNFFGAYKRNEMGVWDNLKEVHIFNRQVDYRSPTREDGLFHVGNLITGWFIWDKSWKENYWKTYIMDVQDYAKLGGIK